jgi:DNA-binding winged helix-turn-helix (wHTH) protein
VLIEREGEVVSKDEIIAAVWPGTVVEDSNLTVQISALRRVLDTMDDPTGAASRRYRGGAIALSQR